MIDWSILRASIEDHWNDLDWWHDVAMQFVVTNALVKPYFRYFAPVAGTDVMAEDWDNLIILDACRYDMFEERHTLPGRLESRVSRGSNTAEFLRRNFRGRTFEDTVYVTANPQVSVRLDDPFHRTIAVWEDGWDDDLNTVPPATMREATANAHEKYPDKRIISHWVQPHYPFIGEFGREHIGHQAGIELSKRMASAAEAKSDHDHVWDMLKRGAVSEAVVRKAYTENLLVTLPHVEELLSELTGTTVVTSDHGNLLGEYPKPCPVPFRLYGHPEGVYSEKLVKVPWLVVTGEERKEIVAEESDHESERPGEEVADRLRDLGYVS